MSLFGPRSGTYGYSTQYDRDGTGSEHASVVTSTMFEVTNCAPRLFAAAALGISNAAASAAASAVVCACLALRYQKPMSTTIAPTGMRSSGTKIANITTTEPRSPPIDRDAFTCTPP